MRTRVLHHCFTIMLLLQLMFVSAGAFAQGPTPECSKIQRTASKPASPKLHQSISVTELRGAGQVKYDHRTSRLLRPVLTMTSLNGNVAAGAASAVGKIDQNSFVLNATEKNAVLKGSAAETGQSQLSEDTAVRTDPLKAGSSWSSFRSGADSGGTGAHVNYDDVEKRYASDASYSMVGASAQSGGAPIGLGGGARGGGGGGQRGCMGGGRCR